MTTKDNFWEAAGGWQKLLSLEATVLREKPHHLVAAQWLGGLSLL
jgi:hypothetical protein